MSPQTANSAFDPATRGAAPATRASIEQASESDSTLERVGEAVEDYGETAEAQYAAADAYVNEKVVDRSKSRSHNIVGAAVTLGLSVIMLILMAIVAGYFVTQAPSDGAFSGAIQQVEDVGGTAFILLAVALLAVPVVAIVGYFMRSGLGGFISGGGMGR